MITIFTMLIIFIHNRATIYVFLIKLEGLQSECFWTILVVKPFLFELFTNLI